MSPTTALDQDERLPWEKRRSETTPAFQAFTLYRDNLGGWSLRRVAEEVGKNRALIEKWSREHSWVDRLEQYLVYMDRRRREQVEAEIDRENRNSVAVGRLMQQAVVARLGGRKQQGDQKAVEALDPNELDAGDIAALSRESQRHIRLGLGQPVDFARGAVFPRHSDLEKIAQDMIAIAHRHLPEERRPAYLDDLEAYFIGGQSPEQLALTA